MKALHPLTEEQRIFAEEHHDFIYQYLNRRHLSIEEYYDTVVFGYLEAVQDYLEKPELKQYQFSTIARIAMRNALAREWEKQSRPMRKAFLEEYEDDTTSLDEFLPSRQERLAEAMDDRSRLLALLAYLTPKERQVVHLQANGYTYHEIAEICKISSHGVNSRFCRLRRKVRSLDGLEGSL
ncbi:RNA polymerase sigma factor [Lachnoclostridium sp. An118]|uniref:RNA polymerase sigma factor n=1 Tax=Lachnoclostridium sp. An118 TaxID=1965547 RepID=UPI0013A5FA63|nr:sigma-70 family RNA polymerase sigma factor [Lachnoclostridium sp. An118]